MAFRDIAYRRLEEFRPAQLRVVGPESAWAIVDMVQQDEQPDPPDQGPGGRRMDLETAIKVLAAVATLAKLAYDVYRARKPPAPLRLDETQFRELVAACVDEVDKRWPLPKEDLPQDKDQIAEKTIKEAVEESV